MRSGGKARQDIAYDRVGAIDEMQTRALEQVENTCNRLCRESIEHGSN